MSYTAMSAWAHKDPITAARMNEMVDNDAWLYDRIVGYGLVNSPFLVQGGDGSDGAYAPALPASLDTGTGVEYTTMTIAGGTLTLSRSVGVHVIGVSGDCVVSGTITASGSGSAGGSGGGVGAGGGGGDADRRTNMGGPTGGGGGGGGGGGAAAGGAGGTGGGCLGLTGAAGGAAGTAGNPGSSASAAGNAALSSAMARWYGDLACLYRSAGGAGGGGAGSTYSGGAGGAGGGLIVMDIGGDFQFSGTISNNGANGASPTYGGGGGGGGGGGTTVIVCRANTVSSGTITVAGGSAGNGGAINPGLVYAGGNGSAGGAGRYVIVVLPAA